MYKGIIEMNYFKKLDKDMQLMLSDLNTLNVKIKKILLINEELMHQIQNYDKKKIRKS